MEIILFSTIPPQDDKFTRARVGPYSFLHPQQLAWDLTHRRSGIDGGNGVTRRKKKNVRSAVWR